ncbi:MAG: RNA 3'-terminal-phosphate cyclase [Myxococcales bacterium 68-20]|nr:RNA 3'-terminal phosphate cyclase [Myxococcales bacterium]OJY27682.1 MAG: RNA 3'-terminal-phosphate cyclase [Myxococcales bacterium 68-20]
MLVIDGGGGEGGGQIVRTALTLSMVTGTPVTIENVRAGRAKPGLLRQHLTALRAAQEVSNAEVTGDELGSRTVTFSPRTVRGGTYRFDVGSAGSAMLVVQTLLPALLSARDASVVEVSGGTHNPMSPPYPFFETTYLPLLRRMGAKISSELVAAGLYPAGGGLVRVEIQACPALGALVLEERGAIRAKRIRALSSRLPAHVAQREIAALVGLLGWHDADARPEVVTSAGPGNVLLALVEAEHVTEVFSGFGERGVRAEEVAARVAREVRAWLEADVPVGEHLADQLVLPMALGAGGSFRTVTPTTHLRTHVELLRRFLGRTIDVREEQRSAYRVDVANR